MSFFGSKLFGYGAGGQTTGSSTTSSISGADTVNYFNQNNQFHYFYNHFYSFLIFRLNVYVIEYNLRC